VLEGNTKMDFEENVGGGWELHPVRIATSLGHRVVG
jgi:hypothetical protein